MELNFKEFGQGDPIVILHGLFGTLDNWQTIAKQLAKDYTVFIVDQRNHGRSPHVPEISYTLMAEDLKYFMEQQWMHQAHILGHSMGGKTAMQFALEYPEMVDRLVIVDIAPDRNVGGHEQIFEALLALDLTQITSRREADEFLEKGISDFGVRQFLLKNLTREKTGGYRWKMNLSALHQHYAEILKEVTGAYPFEEEALFIRGERSNYITTENTPLIKTLFPKAQIESIANAGHWVHADAPELLLSAVQSFLS